MPSEHVDPLRALKQRVVPQGGHPLLSGPRPRARARQPEPRRARAADAITICVAAPAYVGTDLAHQRDQLRWFGGMVGNHVADLVARYGTTGPVPHALTDYIAGRQGYDYAHHGRAGNPEADF